MSDSDNRYSEFPWVMLAVIGILALAVACLQGCGTIAGFGSDLQALGNGTKAAMTHKDGAQ